MFRITFKNWVITSLCLDDSDDYYKNPNPVTDLMFRETEGLLGYKLPAYYKSLIKTRNGGAPKKTCFPTSTPTSWAENHIAISAILGIGGQWGIDSEELCSQFMIT
jgi:hypothetical protein